MKKTIIALMVLAGAACGVEVNSANITIGNAAKDGVDMVVATSAGLDFDYSEYPNQVVNTIDDVVSIHALYAVGGTTGASISTANASITLNIKGTLSMTGAWLLGSDDSFRATVNTTISQTELTTLASDNIVSRWVVTTPSDAKQWGYITYFSTEKVSLTLNGLSGYADGGVIYCYNDTYYAASDVTVSDNSVSIKAGAEAVKFDNYTTYTAYRVGQQTGTETLRVTGMGFVVVPEPATATLSLLALAGLAARRRRK